jgi:hypothetical protein
LEFGVVSLFECSLTSIKIKRGVTASLTTKRTWFACIESVIEIQERIEIKLHFLPGYQYHVPRGERGLTERLREETILTSLLSRPVQPHNLKGMEY